MSGLFYVRDWNPYDMLLDCNWNGSDCESQPLLRYTQSFSHKSAQASCQHFNLFNQIEKDNEAAQESYIREHRGMSFSYLMIVPLLVCCVCRDAKCGKIQCQGGANRPVIGTNAVSIETNIPLQEGGRILCRGTHVYLGDDMPDPGLVLTGTKCGAGMVRAEACHRIE